MPMERQGRHIFREEKDVVSSKIQTEPLSKPVTYRG